uniref:Glutathione S-transferase T3-like n=1 Tax=Tanacetum cinerariifolium TaxID=118510 RepID=A0A699HB82_TANCI|nr:glutathione S-transferase T3-like [Tanacetum cinerariifolium]
MLRNPSPNPNLLRPQSYYHQPYPNQPYQNPAPAPEQYGFRGYGSHPNASQDYASQHSAFSFSHQDYISQTQMGGSSSQPRTDPPMSPINAFSIEELYTPEFSESLQENAGYWQAPNTYEAAGEQVATSPTKNRKKATRNRQKRMIENDDAPRQTPWTTEEGNAKKKQGFWCDVLEYIESKTKQYGRRTYDGVHEKWKTMRPSVIRFSGIYSNVVRMAQESGTRDEDYVQKEMIHYEVETGIPFKLRHYWEVLKDRPKWQEIAFLKFSTGSGGSKRHKSSDSSSFNTEGRDKARAAGRKNKGSKPTGSSTLNEDEMARLMVTEMTALEKEERLAFLEIKRREVECQKREIEQQDTRFYLQPCDHLTGDQQNAMEEIRSCASSELGSELTSLAGSELGSELTLFAGSELGLASYRPPVLDMTDFASWQQQIRLYCQGKENWVNILKSIDEEPFQMGTLRETLTEETKGALHLGPERTRVYSDLTSEENDRYNADIRTTNIIP